MITNKKGLSDVVTTVLIILLVLAAVVIVGNYVLQMVQKGGEKISGATICQGLSAEVVSCKKDTNGATAGSPGEIVYKVTAGDATRIEAIKGLAYKTDGTSTVVPITTIPALYGSEKVTLTDGSAMTQASVAITSVTADDGTVTECTAKESVKVTCLP